MNLPDEKKLIVQGIHIPLPSDDGIQGFMTPYWHEVLEFYPTWAEKVEEGGGDPYPIQPYMLEVAKDLERKEARPGRTADQWMKRYFQHYGPWHLEKFIGKARSDLDSE